MKDMFVSRKEAYKRSKHKDRIYFFLREILWKIVILVLVVPAFISLASYSYITNNYTTYVVEKEFVKNIIHSTITTVYGEDYVEKVKFNYEIGKIDYDDVWGIKSIQIIFSPVDTSLSASDFTVSVSQSGEQVELNEVEIYGEGLGHGFYIRNKKTNEIVNNILGFQYSLSVEREIKEVLETQSTSKIAKWFFETFK